MYYRITYVFFLFILGKNSNSMQKQKSKNKLKPRDLNRKGAEKEGTDMDAYVNPASKTVEPKQDSKEQHVLAPKDTNKELARDATTKELKEKDNHESKKEKEILLAKSENKHAPAEVPKESAPVLHAADKPPVNKEALKELPKIEDNIKSTNICNAHPPVPNDVVDHAKVKEDINLEALVAQKNEENYKVSALHTSNDDNKPATITSSTVVEEKKQEVETPSSSSNASIEMSVTSRQPQLKYTYKEDQWSPINTSGKKIYDRDFLMKLQFDPNSKLKPPNLPNLQAVLKDSLQVR